MARETTSDKPATQPLTIDDMCSENFRDMDSVPFKIQRLSPSDRGRGGHLGTRYVAADCIEDIPDIVLAEFGGGVYSIQPKIRDISGGVRWGKCYRVMIAGDPLDVPASSPLPPQPQAQAPVTQPGDLVQSIGQLIRDFVPPQVQPGAAAPQLDLASVLSGVTSLVGQMMRMQGAPPAMQRTAGDVFSELEKLEKLAGLVDRMRGNAAPAPRVPEMGDDAPSWLGPAIAGLGQLLAKFGAQPQPQPKVVYVQAPQAQPQPQPQQQPQPQPQPQAQPESADEFDAVDLDDVDQLASVIDDLPPEKKQQLMSLALSGRFG